MARIGVPETEDISKRSRLCKYLNPHDQQVVILQSENLERIFVTPNRWGKTTLMIWELLQCCRGTNPWRAYPAVEDPNAPGMMLPHPALGDGNEGLFWLFGPSEKMMKEVHWTILMKHCPREWIESYSKSDMRVTIRHITHTKEAPALSAISFHTYDQDPQSITGAAVHGIVFDELPKEEHYEEGTLRTMDTHGFIMMGFTAVNGPGWWYEPIWLAARRKENDWDSWQGRICTYDEENVRDHHVGEMLVNHLSRAQVVRRARALGSDTSRRIRIFGEIARHEGLIYGNFDRDIHEIDPFEISSDFELWGAVDPGRGFAVVIGGIDKDSNIVILEELFLKDELMVPRFRKLAPAIRGILPQEQKGGSQVVNIHLFVDTAHPEMVNELNDWADKDFMRQIRDEEYPFIRIAASSLDMGLKAVTAGIERVSQLLEPDEDRPTPWYVTRERPEEGEPSIYLLNTLSSTWEAKNALLMDESRLRWEMERWEWAKPPKGKTVEQDKPNEESADGAHMLDALRYLVMARIGPIPDAYEIEEQRREIARKVARAHLSAEGRELQEEFETFHAELAMNAAMRQDMGEWLDDLGDDGWDHEEDWEDDRYEAYDRDWM